MSTLRLVAVASCAFQLAFAPAAQADVVTDWNQTALQATEAAGLPPPPQARVMAMVHAAIYDAVNGIDRRHVAYVVDVKAAAGASIEAATAAAANGVLTRVFPAQQMTLDAAFAVRWRKSPTATQRPKASQWAVRSPQNSSNCAKTMAQIRRPNIALRADPAPIN